MNITIKRCKILCVLLMLLLCNASSCDFNFDKDVKGIKVPEMLWYIADEHGIDYCELLEKAFEGDECALWLFVFIDEAHLYGGGEYTFQHKAVVVQFIRIKGERFFINKMKGYCNKKHLLNLLNWGIDYERNGMMQEDAENNTKTEFPLIYEWLTSDETPDGT